MNCSALLGRIVPEYTTIERKAAAPAVNGATGLRSGITVHQSQVVERGCGICASRINVKQAGAVIT